jgi:hypothetical protein
MHTPVPLSSCTHLGLASPHSGLLGYSSGSNIPLSRQLQACTVVARIQQMTVMTVSRTRSLESNLATILEGALGVAVVTGVLSKIGMRV